MRSEGDKRVGQVVVCVMKERSVARHHRKECGGTDWHSLFDYLDPTILDYEHRSER
jgi:hypothetical protein